MRWIVAVALASMVFEMYCSVTATPLECVLVKSAVKPPVVTTETLITVSALAPESISSNWNCAILVALATVTVCTPVELTAVLKVVLSVCPGQV